MVERIPQDIAGDAVQVPVSHQSLTISGVLSKLPGRSSIKHSHWMAAPAQSELKRVWKWDVMEKVERELSAKTDSEVSVVLYPVPYALGMGTEWKRKY